MVRRFQTREMDLIHVIILVFILWLLSLGSGFLVPYNHLLLVVILVLMVAHMIHARPTE